MKGIQLHVRAGIFHQGFVEFRLAGQDRRRVIEAAAARIPESMRGSLRKQLGPALEKDDIALAASMDSDDGAGIAFLEPCEVIA